ncbi:dihydropteroate synthase [Amphibacillus sp. MSJ-3]|uniref:dihydropteroate synthase n=1 Tax=Amphibacillus sp. MSJ-3 TaxID=2841505 RepID=UPI001C0F05C5|nr:dihydropteroate synthase [Amphibacillus sp. MSJ-3]MBU5595520.1 dihydropteroate synthase [Amphibacillus sp. MSJ-3]
MGILNVTPDSFSDGGQYNDLNKAVEQAKWMVDNGADIIDIGGESTRPGHTPVSVDEEIERVVPIIEKVREVVSVPISIDTYKAKTARFALEAGADIINDIWGAKFDPEIARVASDYQVPIVLMHNRKESVYKNFIEDMQTDLLESIKIAKDNGVKDEQIILDPGIGFAKSMEENIEAIRHLDVLKRMGYPVLLGVSRKRIIDYVLKLPIDERDEGTGATTAFGITKGVDIVRVHDVVMNARIAKMTDVLVGKGVTRNG